MKGVSVRVPAKYPSSTKTILGNRPEITNQVPNVNMHKLKAA